MLKKLIELKHAEECKKYPSMPPAYIPLTKFTDKTANGLTKCVIAWINLHGGQAERINTTGRMIEVKMKDKQSLDQIKYQNAIENAGGQYWLVHNFDEFIFHYDCFIDYLSNKLP